MHKSDIPLLLQHIRVRDWSTQGIQDYAQKANKQALILNVFVGGPWLEYQHIQVVSMSWALTLSKARIVVVSEGSSSCRSQQTFPPWGFQEVDVFLKHWLFLLSTY